MVNFDLFDLIKGHKSLKHIINPKLSKNMNFSKMTYQ